MTVFAGDAIDTGLEINGDPVTVRTFPVGFDVFKTKRADDHAGTGSAGGSGVEEVTSTAGSPAGPGTDTGPGFCRVASRTLSIRGLSWITSMRCSTGRLART